MSRGRLIISFVVVSVLVIYVLKYNMDRSKQDQKNSDAPSMTQSQAPALDTSPEKQKQRLDFIQELKDKGIVYKIENPTKYPRVYVGDGFYVLPLETKESFMGVIAAYHLSINPESNIMILRDHRSGKDIGRFDRSGLHLK